MNSMETIHKSGAIYNDLKHENIMIDLSKNNELEVTLIDFSSVTKYLDKQDNHINPGQRSS